MREKVKIELMQSQNIVGRVPNYRVDRMTNTAEFQIGTWIKQEEVDALIKRGWTVVITGAR